MNTPRLLLDRRASRRRAHPQTKDSIVPHQPGLKHLAYDFDAHNFHCAHHTKFEQRRQAQDGRQGIGTVLCHSVHAPYRPYLGTVCSQKLDRIGATGYMVLRLLMWSPADWRLHGCSASPARKGNFPNTALGCTLGTIYNWSSHLKAVSRGATGRYQGGSVRPPECPDGRWTAPTESPGRVKGQWEDESAGRQRCGVVVAPLKRKSRQHAKFCSTTRGARVV